MSDTNSSNNADLDAAVAQANQLANTILLALRTVHEYISPRALQHGITLSARDKHAWAVSLSIALSQSKAYYRMPATRFPNKTEIRSLKKTELFATSNRHDAIPFSNPTLSPALKKLRQLLAKGQVDEQEVLRVLHEATPQGSIPPASLEQAPERSLSLLLFRWEVTKELIEAARSDAGEAV